MRLSRWVVGMVCATAIAACQSDGNGSGDGGVAGWLGGDGGRSGASGASGTGGTGGTVAVMTGLPPAKVLSEITAAEGQTLCNSLVQSTQSVFANGQLERFTCTIGSLSTSIRQNASGMQELDRAACEQFVSSCIAEGETTTQNNCAEADLSMAFTGCEATVSELQACLGATLAAMRALIQQVTCSAQLSDLMMSSGLVEPLACETFDMKCPGGLSAIGDATEALPEIDGSAGAGGTSGRGGAGGTGGSGAGCTETCRDSMDNFCDDGGEGSHTNICALGTDCSDCGPRP
jgi:hypothetical protein